MKYFVIASIFIFSISLQDFSAHAQESASSSFDYIEIIKSCNHAFVGGCVNVRSGPSRSYAKVTKFRNGIVLKIDRASTTVEVSNGETWYKISFKGEKLEYPEKVNGDWYVNSTYARPVMDVKVENYNPDKIINDKKRIVVDLSEQTLYAYEGEVLFLKTKISTGLTDTPSTAGEYYVFTKTPSRYMQGPPKSATGTLSAGSVYDLPGVPWDMYFSEDGSVIHGTYWHNGFGKRHSHGCVNVNLKDDETLYRWTEVGTTVLITQ